MSSSEDGFKADRLTPARLTAVYDEKLNLVTTASHLFIINVSPMA